MTNNLDRNKWYSIESQTVIGPVNYQRRWRNGRSALPYLSTMTVCVRRRCGRNVRKKFHWTTAY